MNRSEEIKQIWGEMTDDERRQYADSLSDTEFNELEQSLTDPGMETKPPETFLSGFVRSAKDGSPVTRATAATLMGLRGMGRPVLGMAQSGLEQLDKYAGTNYEPAFTERIDRSDAAYRAALQSLSPGEQRAAKSVGMAGEIAPYFAIPGGPAKGLMGVLYTGAVGGAASALSYIPAEERSKTSRLDRFRTGAAAGMLLRGGLEAGRHYPLKYQNILATQAAREGEDISKITGVKLTAGQKSGHPGLVDLEAGASGAASGREFMNKQLLDAEQYMEKTARVFSNKSKEGLTTASGKTLGKIYSQGITRYKTQQSILGRTEYGKFRHVVGKQPAIEMPKFQAAIDDMANIAVPGSAEAKAAATTIQKTLAAQLESGQGKLTADQFLQWREKIARELFQNLDKQGRGRAQKELMTALLIDAENYSGVASTQLKRAVNIWHRGGIQIDKFNKDAMASLFAKETFDPYKISETIPKMTPSRIKGMHEAMRKIPGGEQAWNDMTAAYIYRAMDKSSQHPERLVGQSRFNPNQFFENVANRERILALMPDAAKRTQFLTGMKLLDRAADKHGYSAKAIGIRQTFADVMGNLFSGNPIFIARMTGKIFGPMGLSWVLFSEKGNKALRILATQPKNTPAYQQALGQIYDLLEEDTSNENSQFIRDE